MKIRTKLVLLLTVALVATMLGSTFLRIQWTRERLEAQLQQSTQDTGLVLASELNKELTADSDDDDITTALKEVQRRHPLVADLKLTLVDEEQTSTFSLPRSAEPKLAQRARQALKPAERREEARRALADHGEASRRPSQRAVEPLWRTLERGTSSRWPPRATPPAQPPTPKPPRVYESVSGGGGFEVRIPIDPPGPRKGELVITVTRKNIEEILRDERIVSMEITSGAVLLLMVLTTFIVDRVVGRPVSELESAMRQIEGGSLDLRVEARRTDEVGALSRGFNQMLDRLAQADADIRAFNRRLADEIKAATLDLARKNDALGQLNRLLLEARRELGDKERLAALGQLAAQLAHEIGTPLGSVSGHLQLAMSSRDAPAGLKERLQVATRELERVSKIVRDYLDSTRTVKPERVATDLTRVVDEAIDIALGVERRAKVEIDKQLDAAAVEVETDPALLRQILINLLSNAADAVPASSERGHVEVSARVADGVVALAVRDDGVGISPEDAARIFEPFYTTKGRGKGTGLGLAICRELATALGGRISVESAPGRGSTFTVSLPHGGQKRSAA